MLVCRIDGDIPKCLFKCSTEKNHASNIKYGHVDLKPVSNVIQFFVWIVETYHYLRRQIVI